MFKYTEKNILIIRREYKKILGIKELEGRWLVKQVLKGGGL